MKTNEEKKRKTAELKPERGNENGNILLREVIERGKKETEEKIKRRKKK